MQYKHVQRRILAQKALQNHRGKEFFKSLNNHSMNIAPQTLNSNILNRTSCEYWPVTLRSEKEHFVGQESILTPFVDAYSLWYSVLPECRLKPLYTI
jgi:hypothetical protein